MQRPPILVRQPNLQICSANRAPLNLTECIKWNLWCLWSCLVGATSYITCIYIYTDICVCVYAGCANAVCQRINKGRQSAFALRIRHVRRAQRVCTSLCWCLCVCVCACVFVHVCCVYIVRMFISTFCQLSCTLKRTKCQHK